MIDIMMTMYYMKSLTYVLWIFIDGRVLKKFKLCQFSSIESWGYLYPKTIVVCLEPCHVSRYPNSSYDSIDFSQSCDSGKPHDLSQLSDISNIPPVSGIQ